MSETAAAVDEVDDVVVVPGDEKVRTVTPYEKKLRSEAKNYRIRATEAEAARDKAIADMTATMEARITQERTQAQERVIRAELKAHAIKAGIVDLDGLKLADVSTLKLTDAGDVDGAETLIAKMKEAKPWLFGAASSASVAKPPVEAQQQAKSAKDMTPDEFKAALAKLGVKSR